MNEMRLGIKHAGNGVWLEGVGSRSGVTRIVKIKGVS